MKRKNDTRGGRHKDPGCSMKPVPPPHREDGHGRGGEVRHHLRRGLEAEAPREGVTRSGGRRVRQRSGVLVYAPHQGIGEDVRGWS